MDIIKACEVLGLHYLPESGQISEVIIDAATRIAELEQQLKAMQQIIDGYKDDLKQQKPDRVLLALQLAYRKHHLLDDSVGSTELSDCLCDAICELIGNDGFQSWLGAMEDAGNDNDIFVED